MSYKIILASGSPRRKLLFELAEIDFEVDVADIPEHYPILMQNQNVPIFIARNKASAVAAHYKADVVTIGADTVVILENEILGKPVDENDAIQMLKKLSGKMHEVVTGVAIVHNLKITTFKETSYVYFNELTDEQIKYYVTHFKPYDKAGAYALQEWIGEVGIKEISGNYYNVMGLPMARLMETLEKMQIQPSKK